MTTAKYMRDIDMLSGSGEKFRLENVLYVPSVQKNLFSTCRFTNKGAKMFADSEIMQIKKDQHTITLPMEKDHGRSMYYMRVKRITDESVNDVAESHAAPSTNDSTKIKMPRMIDINIAHGLCHLGEKLLRATFNSFGVKLSGTLLPCNGCCRANAKAKGVRKNTATSATEIGD